MPYYCYSDSCVETERRKNPKYLPVGDALLTLRKQNKTTICGLNRLRKERHLLETLGHSTKEVDIKVDSMVENHAHRKKMIDSVNAEFNAIILAAGYRLPKGQTPGKPHEDVGYCEDCNHALRHEKE